jgi:hypothetical protein
MHNPKSEILGCDTSPSVSFEWLNDNVIKGLTRLLSVNRKYDISHVLNESKKWCIVGNNLVQIQDNNANIIHARLTQLWDFYGLCESKHVEELINET